MEIWFGLKDFVYFFLYRVKNFGIHSNSLKNGMSEVIFLIIHLQKPLDSRNT